MAGIPTNFQAISNVLANYNFVDIVSGTGYIVFYAGTTADLKLLSNFTYYSYPISFSSSTLAGAYTKLLDYDFDVTINRPLDVKGIGIVNVPLALTGNAGIYTGVGKIVATLKKWNGSTETDIVSNEHIDFTEGTAVKTYFMTSIDLNVPLTHFKIGETLRLTIEAWAYTSNADGVRRTYIDIAADPKSRTTGWDTTGAVPSQLVFQCPVRLNL